MGIKIIAIVLLMFGIYSESKCQTTTAREFLLVTFEFESKPSIHGKRVFHWITPVDSVADGKLRIKPLYVDVAYTIEECMTLIRSFNKDDNFREQYSARIDSLFKLDSKHRWLYQEVKSTRFDSRISVPKKETTKVFLSLFKGIFIECPISRGMRSGWVPLTGFKSISRRDFDIDFAGFNFKDNFVVTNQ